MINEEVRLPDGRWGDSTRRPDGVRVHGALVVRFAAPLFFANGTALATRIRELLAGRPDVGIVVLDLGATPSVDLTAAGTLAEIDRELRRDGRQLAVARALGTVRDDLRAFGLGSLMATPDAGRGAVDEVIAGHGWDPATLLDQTTSQPMPVAEPVTAPLRRRRTTKE
jgi:MFS superfamily sulfate permease-like transporter